MSSGNTKAQFQLETLESRILLSADGLFSIEARALVESESCANGNSPAELRQEHSAWPASATDDFLPNPPGKEAEEILALVSADTISGLVDNGTRSEQQDDLEGSSDQGNSERAAVEVDAEVVIEAAATVCFVIAIDPVAVSDFANPLPAQLTETLRSANGPPSTDSDSGSVSISTVGTSLGSETSSNCEALNNSDVEAMAVSAMAGDAFEDAADSVANAENTHLTPDQSLIADGGLMVGSSDMLSGSGTIFGDVVNRGILSPGNSPGIITIEGNLTLTDAGSDVIDDDYTPDGTNTVGSILIELAGGVAGTDYDQVNVTGKAKLGGALQIQLLNGFQPELGQEFDVLTYGSVEGTFDDYQGLVLSNGCFLKPVYSPTKLSLKVVATESQPLPVVFIPGFGGTFAADTSADGLKEWFLHRGLSPEQLALEPLTNAYSNLVQSLVNLGYTIGVDLFVANWDWRVPVARQDSVTNNDGILADVTADTLTDSIYESGVDYLGYWLNRAVETWMDLTGSALASVDIITHSTGGLVARSYIQSVAYQDRSYAGGTMQLPQVNQLIQTGVPNQGVSSTFNFLQNDFSDKPASRVLGRIIDIAYDYLLAGEDIHNPDGSIIDHLAPPSKVQFIQHYVATLRDLLAAYPFADLDGTGPGDYVMLTALSTASLPSGSIQNDLIYDLNAPGQTGGINGFVDRVLGKVTIVYSSSVDMADQVTLKSGFQLAEGLKNEILPFDQLIGNFPDGNWYLDQESSGAPEGDGTVPTISSWGTFAGDHLRIAGGTLSGLEITTADAGEVDHSGLTNNVYSQRKILQVLKGDSDAVAAGYVISDDLMLSTVQAGLKLVELGILDPVDYVVELVQRASELDDLAEDLAAQFLWQSLTDLLGGGTTINFSVPSYSTYLTIVISPAKILLGVTGTSAFLGVGDTGVKLNDLQLGFVLYNDFSYAIDALGHAAIVGVPGLVLNGGVRVRGNSAGPAVDETIVVPVAAGGTQTVSVAFNQIVGFEISGDLNLVIADFVYISGSFSFTPGGTETVTVTTGISGNLGALADAALAPVREAFNSVAGLTIGPNFSSISGLEVNTVNIGIGGAQVFLGMNGPYWTDLDQSGTIGWSFNTGQGTPFMVAPGSTAVTLESITYSAGETLPNGKLVTLTAGQIVQRGTVNPVKYGDWNNNGVVDVNETAELNPDSVGLQASGVEFGLVLMTPSLADLPGLARYLPKFFALKATVGSMGLVGIPGVTATATMATLKVNGGSWPEAIASVEGVPTPVVDFEASFPGDAAANPAVPVGYEIELGNNSSVCIDYPGDGILGVSAANVTLDLGGFVYLSGSLSFEQGGSEVVTVSTGVPADLGALAGDLLDAFNGLPTSEQHAIAGLWVESDLSLIHGLEVGTVKIGIGGAQAFLGLNGPYWTDLDGDHGISFTDAAGNTLIADTDTDGFVDVVDGYGDKNKNGLVDAGESAEINGNALGLQMSDVDFGMVLMAPTLADLPGFDQIMPKFYALKATVGSAGLVGLEDVLKATVQGVEVKVNGGAWPEALSFLPEPVVDFAVSFPVTPDHPSLGYEIALGNGSSLFLDYGGGIIGASAADVTLQISDFVYITGSFAFEKGESSMVSLAGGLLGEVVTDVQQLLEDYGLPDDLPIPFLETTKELEFMTIGAAHVSAFVGINGPYLLDSNTDGRIDALDTPNPEAVGLVIDDFTFGMAIMTPTNPLDPAKYYSLHASADRIGLVGMEGVTLQVQEMLVEINQSTPAVYGLSLFPVVDFARSFPGELLQHFDSAANGEDPNGKLEAWELPTAVQTALGVSGSAEVTWDAVLAQYDSNQDGVLTTAEAGAELAVADLDDDGKIDTAGFEVGTGGDPVLLDMNSSLIRAQGFVEMNILGVLTLTGSVAFELGPTQEVVLADHSTKTVTTMTLGAADVTAFAGIHGPYWSDLDGDHEVSWSDANGTPFSAAEADTDHDGVVDVGETAELNPDAVGFAITDLDIGIVVMASTSLEDLAAFLAARVSIPQNGFTFVGIDEFMASGSLEIELNVGLGVHGFAPVNFVASFPSEKMALFDTDKNGQITVGEVRALNGMASFSGLYEAGTPAGAVLDLNLIVAVLDAGPNGNGDEKLDVNEAALLAGAAKAGAADADHDGKLEHPAGFAVNTGNRDAPVLLDFDSFWISVDLSGQLMIAEFFDFEGQFTFKATTEELNVTADARLNLALNDTNIFSFAVKGSLQINSAGVVAAINVSLASGFSIPGGLGIGFDVTYRLELNTTGDDVPVTGFGDIRPGARIHASGKLTILVLEIVGQYEISVDSEKFMVAMAARVTIFGASLEVNGSAGIYYDEHPGFAFSIQLRLAGSDGVTVRPFPGFSISGAFQLVINTSDAERFDPLNSSISIAANSFRIGVTGLSVNLFGFVLSGSLSLGISQDGFSIDIPTTDPLTLDFFGIITLQVSGYLHPDGQFLFSASASIKILDPDIFGFEGNISVEFSNDGFAGGLSGTFGAFGIKLQAGGEFYVTSGFVKISVYLKLVLIPAFSFKIWTPWKTYWVRVPELAISGHWTMTFGSISENDELPPPPPPPELARVADNTLYLNIGDDVIYRGSLYPSVDENYQISLVGPGTNIGQKLKVSALGHEQIYDNITGIVVTDTQGQNDYIAIANDVTVPVSINVGRTVTGQNRFVTGGGPAIIQGGSNSDKVEFGLGGGTYIGGPGTSTVTDNSGGLLTVTAPGYAHYLLTDESLTYGNGDDVVYVMTFEEVKRVILNGAPNATYETSSLPDPADDESIAHPWSGYATFNGSGTASVVQANTAANLTLTNNSITDSTGVTITLNNIAIANLYGGDGDNIFNISGWTRSGSISGGEGSDKLVAANDAEFILTDTSLIRSSGGQFTLAGVELADLTGGANANRFTLSNWSGAASLYGLGGDDTYYVNLVGAGSGVAAISDSAGSSDSVTINGPVAAQTFMVAASQVQCFSEIVSYSGLETLTVNGNTASDVFQINTLSVPTTITGGLDHDTLIGPNDDNTWHITGANAGDFGLLAFSGIENLKGGGANDNFVVGYGAGVSGTIDGAAGSNKLEFSGNDSNDDVLISAPVVNANGVVQLYTRISTLTVNTFGGPDAITVNPAANGFPTQVNLNTGDDDDVVSVNLLAGVVTRININGGAPSASDSLIVFGTSGADTININGPTLGFESTVIGSTGIENLTVASGDGDDAITLTGDAASQSVRLLVEGGDDIIMLAYPILTGSMLVDGGSGANNELKLSLTTADQTLTLDGSSIQIQGAVSAQYSHFASLTLDTLDGADVVNVIDTHTGTTTLSTGAGNDIITIRHTIGTLDVYAGDGADTVNVQSVAGGTNVNLGSGDDVVNVSSYAPATGGTLIGIARQLNIAGDGGTDTLNVDDSGDDLARTGTLSAAQLSGLGMEAGLGYADCEALNIWLGAGGDIFTFASTHAGTTVLVTNGGEDTVTVLGTGGMATINAGDGNDDIHVQWMGAALTVSGEAGSDTLAGPDNSNLWTLAENNTGDLNGLLAFSSIESIVGGADTDMLVGPETSNTWRLRGNNTGNLNGALTFSSIENLVGGSGDDTFAFDDGAAVDGTIHGDGGINHLDYSAYATAAVVDLQTGEATGTAGVQNFVNVRGGLADDILGGDDSNNVLEGMSGNDILVGRGGADTIQGGLGDDVVVGDQGSLIFGAASTTGSDGIFGDILDGGEGNDLIFGDSVALDGSTSPGHQADPRFRLLLGPQIYGADGNPLVTGVRQTNPGGIPAWSGFRITLLHGSSTNEADDYIAGGAGDDLVFGQTGEDVIQGDGSTDISRTGDARVGACRDGDNLLQVNPSFGAATDGDDYIEGGPGNDVIFGNLGQDDLIGGSSNLFGLDLAEQRSDGSDLIFGGSGTALERNNPGDASTQGHANDSDMILGDNGNIYRLVGGGAYLTFNYDDYGNTHIIPRAAELLDYTLGGTDYNPAVAAMDFGAVDEIHGETGDDFIYGMRGNDVLFGEGQDDDLMGGYGNDWLSGGTGQDGVLGDDGWIYTSRNGLTEPLYGLTQATIQTIISTPGKIQQATINVAGQLKKMVVLTPFNIDPNGVSGWVQDPLFDPAFADDIIFGGWGSDFLHGGAGDDAISGAEALAIHYAKPLNPGDILRWSQFRAGEFGFYDEYNPMRRVFVDGDYQFAEPDTGGSEFILNFSANHGQSLGSGFFSDGDDVLFGDLGNDALYGGTGRDNLYGGYGDDLLNADDDLDTHGGLNDQPDTHVTYEDRAYGGAGRDVLIANTGGDRLIDWAGNFNCYLEPSGMFGPFTISRTLQPHVQEFLYALSKSDGADQTLGFDSLRNGEPEGELGLVLQKDADWKEQTGAPDDPLPGNIPGGAREVVQSANFNTGSMEHFAPDSGDWNIQDGSLSVTAESQGGDAVSVFHVPDLLPAYFEIQASIQAVKPTAGWKSNAYVIFDYQSPTDFKFAGVSISLNKIVMGHRNAQGWIVDVQSNVQVKPTHYYNLLVGINGTSVTVVVDGAKVFSYAFAPRVVDGWSYGLNAGMVGVGSDNSRGLYDNIKIQKLPAQIEFEHQEDFSDGNAGLFGGFATGDWDVTAEQYGGTPTAGTGLAVSLVDLGLGHGLQTNSYLELSAKVTAANFSGVVFDQYSPEDFKFVALDSAQDQVVIGHHTARGWFLDMVLSKSIEAGSSYDLTVSLKGTTVSVTLDNQVLASKVFNAAVVDGSFGLITVRGPGTFDDVTIKTDDSAFRASEAPVSLSAAIPPLAGLQAASPALTVAALDAIVIEAMARWQQVLTPAQFSFFSGLTFRVADLPGATLAQATGHEIVVDAHGAGHGWFVDASAGDDLEFQPTRQPGILQAKAGNRAEGSLDLLTAVMHELGHRAGLTHGANAVMQASLSLGMRWQPPLVPGGIWDFRKANLISPKADLSA